jgi:hypothetical protein
MHVLRDRRRSLERGGFGDVGQTFSCLYRLVGLVGREELYPGGVAKLGSPVVPVGAG